jgi:chromosomal replication initiation ATPase DnaA
MAFDDILDWDFEFRSEGLNGMMDMISKASGLSVEVIKSPSRRIDLVFCRSIVAYNARQKGYSHREIGDLLNRNRTTVIHLLKNYNSERSNLFLEIERNFNNLKKHGTD